MLHSKACTTEMYLKISCRCEDSSSRCLTISPEHLMRVRQGSGLAESSWDWMPAQNVRPDDWLEDERGEAVVVQSVSRACCVGAFAPLTVSGHLLVNGLLCSCYAP